MHLPLKRTILVLTTAALLALFGFGPRHRAHATPFSPGQPTKPAGVDASVTKTQEEPTAPASQRDPAPASGCNGTSGSY